MNDGLGNTVCLKITAICFCLRFTRGPTFFVIRVVDGIFHFILLLGYSLTIHIFIWKLHTLQEIQERNTITKNTHNIIKI